MSMSSTNHEKTLIAILGHSPSVVTSFIQHFSQPLHHVVIIANKNEMVKTGAEMIKIALSIERSDLTVDIDLVDIEDVSSESEYFSFTKTLVKVIEKEKNNNHDVYLSVTGGRGVMSVAVQSTGQILGVEGIYSIAITKPPASMSKPSTARNLVREAQSEWINKFTPTLSDEERKTLYLQNREIYKQILFPENGQEIIRLPIIPDLSETVKSLVTRLQFIDEGSDELTGAEREKLSRHGFIYTESERTTLSRFGKDFLRIFQRNEKDPDPVPHTNNPEKTLILIVGQTPSVITSFVERFTLPVHHVIIIATRDKSVTAGTLCAKTGLNVERSDLKVHIRYAQVEDVNSETGFFEFCSFLHDQIREQRNFGREIYMSLTGGRALMSIAVYNIGQIMGVEGIFSVTNPNVPFERPLQERLDLMKRCTQASEEEHKKIYLEHSMEYYNELYPDLGQKIIRLPTIPDTRDSAQLLLADLQAIKNGTEPLTLIEKGKCIQYGYVLDKSVSAVLTPFGEGLLVAFDSLIRR